MTSEPPPTRERDDRRLVDRTGPMISVVGFGSIFLGATFAFATRDRLGGGLLLLFGTLYALPLHRLRKAHDAAASAGASIGLALYAAALFGPSPSKAGPLLLLSSVLLGVRSPEIVRPGFLDRLWRERT